jgi:drug/metabolite transporter (DMT)-like permease
VFRTRSDAALALSLVFAVFLWGGTNTGTRFIVQSWPPVWSGASRFLCAGLLMLAALRWTRWLGAPQPLTAEINRRLWWHGGLSLAAYIVCFYWALHFTPVSHVALYLGASPVWALLWEGRPAKSWNSVQRYAAAALALSGVLVLFAPAMKAAGGGRWIGEFLALIASVLWTNYGRQCRELGATLSGVEVSAHTMWRAGLLLMVPGIIELARNRIVLRPDLLWIQLGCILGGSVIAFAIWNRALSQWPASQVLLFNNLIPLSTMAWAHFCLGEPVTTTFWLAMILIVGGVVLRQTNWQLLSRATAPVRSDK